MKIHRTDLEIVRGSVLEIAADAIVNAANTGMRGGGALDGTIHRAAGPQMLEELRILAPNGSKTAQVIVTGAYNLPQQWVFHVAGPVWKPDKSVQCDELLRQSYSGCLEAAENLQLESLAFPSLSTGVYAFPLERAAPLALQTVVEWLENHPETSLRRITFALFGGTEYHYFRQQGIGKRQ